MLQSLAGTASSPSTATASKTNDWTNEFQRDNSGFIVSFDCAACAKFKDIVYILL